MTKTQYKTLKPYEKHFATAANNYIHGVYHSDIVILLPIYNTMGGKLTNMNCSDCILTMFKTLGREYNKYKKKYEK